MGTGATVTIAIVIAICVLAAAIPLAYDWIQVQRIALDNRRSYNELHERLDREIRGIERELAAVTDKINRVDTMFREV